MPPEIKTVFFNVLLRTKKDTDVIVLHTDGHNFPSIEVFSSFDDFEEKYNEELRYDLEEMGHASDTGDCWWVVDGDLEVWDRRK